MSEMFWKVFPLACYIAGSLLFLLGTLVVLYRVLRGLSLSLSHEPAPVRRAGVLLPEGQTGSYYWRKFCSDTCRAPKRGPYVPRKTGARAAPPGRPRITVKPNPWDVIVRPERSKR